MGSQSKVSIGIILYKAEKYLPYTLKSLAEQDYGNIEFLFRDQSPNLEAYEYIKKELPEYFKNFKIQKGTNRMHSGGQNDLINQSTGDYYICASNDMLYPKDFVSSIVKEMEKGENQGFGTATVKLMQWDFENKKETNIIDSCGIGIKQSHHFYDRGQGEEDKGQYDNQKSIFGGSGALVVFRKSALDVIGYENEAGKKEYFDELLHYKNDVDLAYRNQWAGRKCLFFPNIKVYHDRQVAAKAQGVVGILKSRSGDKNNWAKESSYLGQQIVVLKNFSDDFSFWVKFKTWFYSFASFVYILLFERFLLEKEKEVQSKMKEIEYRKSKMKLSSSVKEIEGFMC